jgi:hypothetical protein
MTRHLSGRIVRVLAFRRRTRRYGGTSRLGFENMEIKESLKKYLSPLLSFPSKLIDIFSMPHALNFYQLQFNDDLIDNAIVAETNALRVLRPAQFFHAGGKGFSARSSTVSTIRPSALAGNLRKSLGSSIFFGGTPNTACGTNALPGSRFLPLNAKGHGVSALS